MAQRAVAEVAIEDGLKRQIRPIDLVHLAKQCLGDENLEREILRLFDTTLKTYYERLVIASGFDDLAMNLHSIKGAAVGVGAWTIADLAKGMETELRDGRPLKAERIDDLGIAVEEVRDFVSRMLASEAA
jgi:HPt (histidine-containing phosphotransfer) domain-containing protein